jgi:putative ATPase
VIEEALQKRTLLYDRAGDEHYGVVSAFIKSMRGSDPDAAVYWMARMIEAGEDPLFVLRRMVIFAAEDVGVADPRALLVATAAVEAFRFIGLPGRDHPDDRGRDLSRDRAQTNTAIDLRGREERDAHGALAVPNHIATRRAARQRLGWGAAISTATSRAITCEGTCPGGARPPVLPAVRFGPRARHRRAPRPSARRSLDHATM